MAKITFLAVPVKNLRRCHYAENFQKVDEIHIINEEGCIKASSVEQYVDFDMYSGEQSSSFMKLAEDRNEGESFVQETMPNSSEGVVMKYVGVICGNGKIVQVGFKPVRELEAKQRNTYEYIFQKFPTSRGSEYFAIDIETDTILGQEYGNLLLGLAGPANEMYVAIFGSTLKMAMLLFCSMLIMIFALNLLLKRIVVDGVYEILSDVSDITSGNLDTVVPKTYRQRSWQN